MNIVRWVGNAIQAVTGRREVMYGVWMNNTIVNQFRDFQDYIEKGYQLNADIYSIVSFIASKASLAPFSLYEIKNEKMFRKYKGLTTDATPASLKAAAEIQYKAMSEIEGDHPMLKILNESPNENMTGSEFRYAAILYKLLTGNTYIKGFAPESEDPVKKFVELYVLPSAMTHPVSDGLYQPVKGYKLEFVPDSIIPKDEVLHVRYFNPNFSQDNPHVIGQSPLKAAEMVTLRSNSGYEATTKAYQNGGLTGVLYEDGQTTMSNEQREAMQKHIDQKMTGPGNFKQIIAASSKLGWIQVGSSPVDLGILETMRTDLRTLCNIFHVNSALFNDPENKTYNNMSEARKAALTDAVIPELMSFRDGINAWFVPGWSKADKKKYFVDVDTSVYAELQENMKELAEWLEKAWWIDPNEKRAQMNYDKKGPEFDQCYVPAGLSPMNELNEPLNPDEAFEKIGMMDYQRRSA